MISLRSQTIKILAISFITIAIAGTVCVILDSRSEEYQKLFLEGKKLSISAPKQVQLLVPGLLMEEEFGSINLHLQDIKAREQLTKIELRPTKESFHAYESSANCKHIEDSTTICVDRKQRRVITITPVTLVNKSVGFLIKEKQFPEIEMQAPLFRPLLGLIVGFSSAFLLIAVWITNFLKRDVRQPLLNLKDILIPVLQNKKGAKFPKFKVAEVQALATQVGQLVLEFEERRVNSTIANTASYLAHDLKRPMAIIKTGLEMIERANDPEQIRHLASALQIDVDQAMREADEIIGTTLEFSAKPLVKTQTSPESLIDATLKDIFRLYPSTDIPISYKIRHTRDVSVDVQMTLRVFANIVGNAVEAMRGTGRIWFATQDVSEKNPGFIEFCIGNSKSTLSEEDLANVFDPFFTKGKLKGRGLGLAIAQKVVSDHGGRIWCISIPGKGVEFHFTLPTAGVIKSPAISNLPVHSREISDAFIIAMQENSSSSNLKNVEQANRTILADYVQQTGKKFTLQFIDNEPIYFEAIKMLIAKDQELKESLEIFTAQNSQDALLTASIKIPLLIVCDYDMGKHSLTGLEIAAALRSNGTESFICIHSARHFSLAEVTCAGADHFLPKPLSIPDLISIIVLAIKSHRQEKFNEDVG